MGFTKSIAETRGQSGFQVLSFFERKTFRQKLKRLFLKVAERDNQLHSLSTYISGLLGHKFEFINRNIE